MQLKLEQSRWYSFSYSKWISSRRKKTTVSIYKVVKWNAAGSTWELGKGVDDADVTLTTNPVTIKWKNFAAKRENLEQVATTTVTDGTVTFHGLDIGAYYVYAQSDKNIL